LPIVYFVVDFFIALCIIRLKLKKETVMDLCTSCGKRQVVIKKRQLCMTCYQRLYSRGKKHSGTGLGGMACPVTVKKYENAAEIEFIRAYFDHPDWIHQPTIFRFTTGGSYTPDFYDKRKNVFIEVIGTRQAYHKNKDKYDLFRAEYPEIHFEIRKSDGSLLNEEDERLDWGGTLQAEVRAANE